MRISDWSSDVCSSDLARYGGMTIYCRTRIVFSTRHRPTIRPCHLSEFLASREWLTERKAWPRHPLLSQKCIPLKKLLRYQLALCHPVASVGLARQVDSVFRCVTHRFTVLVPHHFLTTRNG